MLLLTELLIKPLRERSDDEAEALTMLLSQLELLPVDRPTAALATVLGADYGLRTADAVHLATAVGAGADRYLTNNRRGFPQVDHRDRRRISDRPPAAHVRPSALGSSTGRYLLMGGVAVLV